MAIEEASHLELYIFKNIFYQRVKNHIKLFSCFVFADTYIFVSHGQYISIFDVVNKKWIEHLKFNNEIIQIFRSENG